MDKRLTPFNGRVAHSSLKGQVAAERFVEGTPRTVTTRTADVCDEPGGAIQCQLLFGETFVALEETDHHTFGMREMDGYVGWVSNICLRAPSTSPFVKPAQKVIVPFAAFLDTPDVKTALGVQSQPLSFGSLVRHQPINNEREDELEAAGWLCAHYPTGHISDARYIKRAHLAPLEHMQTDPAEVAMLFHHVPYRWGGDSTFGIDCSGLVQRCLVACGIRCPRDSDMQEAAFPHIDPNERQRGDLVFWKGHVGMLLDPDTLIHANAHHMAVAIEPLAQAILRIGKKEFGDVTGYARP